LSIGYGPSAKNPPEDFHGWKVIGKTKINDPDVRRRLIAALEKGVEENKGDSMKCFDPRHGIRVTRDGGLRHLFSVFSSNCVCDGWEGRALSYHSLPGASFQSDAARRKDSIGQGAGEEELIELFAALCNLAFKECDLYHTSAVRKTIPPQ